MSDSESSALSSVPSEEEPQFKLTTKDGVLKFVAYDSASGRTAAKESTSPARKREPSPPHEYVLADNPDIPFLVMFRSRFNDCFPKSLAHYGPQDIERGVQDTPPGEHVENLLCALLGLVLNRKKNPERGHFHRAIEEAISTQKTQWPFSWNGVSPLAGAKTFATMDPTERLALMKTLALWSLTSSESVQARIKESYKQSRHEDDLNQPLSVQPWGKDGEKSRYWLIEGLDDTSFRVYRDTAPTRIRSTWWSVAGSIDELKDLSQTLRAKKTWPATRLSDNITKALPRFEATEDILEQKRKRREYRIMRKQQFARPEPGYSLYEGRTRGKRMRYTFSDDEDDASDEPSGHRSTRNSGISTPGEAADAGPTFTASGRQVKSRIGGAYGETVLSSRNNEPVPSSDIDEINANDVDGGSRPRRSGLRQEINGWAKGDDHIETYNSVDEMEDEDEAASSGADDYAGDYEDEDDNAAESVGNEMDVSEDEEEEDENHGRRERSLVVQLKVPSKAKPAAGSDTIEVMQDGDNSFEEEKSEVKLTNGVKNYHLDDSFDNEKASAAPVERKEEKPLTNGAFSTAREDKPEPEHMQFPTSVIVDGME